MPGRAGPPTCGVNDIPFARAKRSSRYQRAAVPPMPRNTADPTAIATPATSSRGSSGMNIDGPEASAIAPMNAVTTVTPTEANTKRMTTAMIRPKTADPGNRLGARPDARSSRANARAARGSIGSVSGRASKGRTCAGVVIGSPDLRPT